MATRLLEQYKWTKDGRKWVFYTWETTLSGKKRKKFSKAYHTKKEALLAEREYAANLNSVVDDKSMTFRELYTAYYEYQKEFVIATKMGLFRGPSGGSMYFLSTFYLLLLFVFLLIH